MRHFVCGLPMRILIVEDAPILADRLTRSLHQSDYAVDCVASGDQADHVLLAQNYDLVILDLGLPRLDGFEVLRRLRHRGSKVPVLILTARDGLDDRVRGLDLGADDYLTKPFDLPEFEARVRALMRRGQQHSSNVLRHGRLHPDLEARRVFHEGKPIDFSARELAVMELLMSRQGRVVTKEQMVDRLFGWGEDVGSNAIEVCVHRVRRKLEPFGVEIRTVRGMGYLMEKSVEAQPSDAP